MDSIWMTVFKGAKGKHVFIIWRERTESCYRQFAAYKSHMKNKKGINLMPQPRLVPVPQAVVVWKKTEKQINFIGKVHDWHNLCNKIF